MLGPAVLKRIRGINRQRNKVAMFMNAQHPGSGSTLRPNDESVRKVIGYGWWGQKKINGFSWQAHISAQGELVCFTRHGGKHTRQLQTEIKDQILTHLTPATGWNVVVGEWQFTEKKMYLFDVLKLENESFQKMNYGERYKILKNDLFFLSPNIEFLPVYRTVKQCLGVLEKAKTDKTLDGLVFKNPKTPGWQNTSIVRCLKGK